LQTDYITLRPETTYKDRPKVVVLSLKGRTF